MRARYVLMVFTLRPSSALISDPAGIDDSTAQVLIGDKTDPQFKLPLTRDTTGAYSTLFDTRLLTSCKLPPSQSLCIVRPTVSYRAADSFKDLAKGLEGTLAELPAFDPSAFD